MTGRTMTDGAGRMAGIAAPAALAAAAGEPQP